MERIDLYSKRLGKYSKDLKRVEKKLNNIGYLRLVIVGIGLTLMFYSYFYISSQFSWLVVIVSVIIFFLLIRKYEEVEDRKRRLESLCHINETSIKRLKGMWYDFPQKGQEFLDDNHPYSKDLDIFGQGSLFQWVNVCETKLGKKKLADSLSRNNKCKEELESIQEVAKELSQKVDFREKLNSLTYLLNKDGLDKEETWWEGESPFYKKGYIRFICRFLPLITLAFFASHYILEVIASTVPIALLGLHFVMIMLGFGKRGKVLNDLFYYSNNLKAYKELLLLIKNEKLVHKKLQRINNQLVGKEKDLIKEISLIDKIAQRASNRNNLFFFPINVILLWDYQSMISLEIWKERNSGIIETIQNCVGELEYLSNLAKITYDNPSWTFPRISEEKSIIKAKSIGHPLIQQGMVANDVQLDDNTPILLITGSNMSGKSTLLRTIGINLVLAFAGAPVCAAELETSFFDVYTTMRISDDLEKGISSFYGELLRIKEILIKSKESERQSFVLLDEIFKGTNSYDRHLGAKALVKQLLKMNCMGLVSTHDLELEVLEAETCGIVKNYHFQEFYVNDKINFDYKIKSGVSKTRNAMYLLKLIGIEGLDEYGDKV